MVDICCLRLLLTGCRKDVPVVWFYKYEGTSISIGIVLVGYVYDCSSQVMEEKLFYKHKEITRICIGMKIVLFGGYVCIILSLTGVGKKCKMI